MVEQVADAAAQQAEHPFRQNSGRDHIAHHLMAEQARRRRRLCQHRHAGEQCAGRLFPQPPAWEIEGVDVYGRAVPRREQMDRLVIFSFGQAHRLAVDK